VLPILDVQGRGHNHALAFEGLEEKAVMMIAVTSSLNWVDETRN